MGHLSWQSLSAQAPSGDCRLQAVPAFDMDPCNGHLLLLWHPARPGPRRSPGYRGATRFALLLFDTQSSLPFNTLRKHIKWKFRARRAAPRQGVGLLLSATPGCGWGWWHPCKVLAFAQRTHFSCDICKSKTNFHSSDSKTMECLKGLLATGFARQAVRLPRPSYCCLIFTQCSLHICHCVCTNFFRGEILASICSKKRKKKWTSSCESVLFCFLFKCFINKNPGAFCSIVPHAHTHTHLKLWRSLGREMFTLKIAVIRSVLLAFFLLCCSMLSYGAQKRNLSGIS